MAGDHRSVGADLDVQRHRPDPGPELLVQRRETRDAQPGAEPMGARRTDDDLR
jgi:hypothetical protein